MASRQRESRSVANEVDAQSPDPARLNSSSSLSTAGEEADDSLGGASSRAGGKKRGRVEINRRVPQQSFAYGAPSDAKSKPRSSGSSAGRKSMGEGASPPAPRDASPDKPPPVTGAPDEGEASVEDAKLAAAARYAKLKASKNKSNMSASKSSLNLASQSSPAPRRSARLSVASGSVDGEGGVDARRQAIAEIEEDLAESSGEEDEHGNTRKSSVPPTVVGNSMPASTSASTLTGRSRGGGTQLNSFFLRDPGRSISPASIEERRNHMVTTSSLLRGVQRPFRDPLSPNRTDGDLTRSSDAGDSRSYASEEAFVQRQGQDEEEREITPPSRATSWLQNLSPWRRGIASSNGQNGHSHTGQDPLHTDAHDNLAPRHAAPRRRPRNSNDKTYRPEDGGEEEDSSQESDAGKGRRPKGRKSDDRNRTARGGRDDNRIWSTSKSRKGARRRNGTAANGEGDSTLEGLEDEEGDNGRESTAEATSGRPYRSARLRALPGLQGIPSSLLSSGYKYAGLLLVGLLLAGLLAPSDGSSDLSSSWFSRKGAYAPPSSAPKDFENFVSRLLSLESTVGALSSKSVSLAHSHEQMSLRLSALELSSREVKALLSKLEVSEGRTTGLEDRLKVLENVGVKLQNQLEKVERMVPHTSQMQENAQQEYQNKVDRRLQALQTELHRNTEEMVKVRASVLKAQDVAQRASDALQPLLAANLPAQMPVRLDKKTGKPTIEPWFYESLRAMITQAGGKEVDGTVSSWEKFRNDNEASLRAMISQETSESLAHHRSAAGGHAILSRSDFLEVLRSEIDGIKSTLEETFNRNAQEMQNDILAKVRDQQTMYEESGSWSKRKKGSKDQRRQQQQEPGRSSLTPSVDLSALQTKDGSDPTDSILALVEAALETYSADKINKADYALYSAGGRIIPSMTSPSLQFSPPGSGPGRSSWLSWIPGMGAAGKATDHLRSRSPVVALHHDSSPGMCWPFAGQSGQLGIHLSHRVLVTDITIEHPSAALTFGDHSAAPKEFTVSALVERPEDQRKLSAWRSESVQRLRNEASAAAAGEDEDGEVGGEVEIAEAPASSNHLHLATFVYDASTSRPRSIQTFPVSPEARALGIPVSVLQVRVLSNHGNQRYTCLYRVRVHGEKVTEGAEGE